MISIHRSTVERLVHREITENEWNRLQKAEFHEVLHWVNYHINDRINN